MGFVGSMTRMICGGVSLPKTLYIQNTRLGFLYRVMQLAALVVAVSQIIVGRSWLTVYVPAAQGFSIWFSDGDKSDLADSTGLHCVDPAAFRYQWSDSFVYQPSGCKTADTLKIFSKESSLSAYYATYAQDTEWWNGSPADCGAHTRAECQRQGGTYTENGDSCTCSKYRDYFVKNVEMHKLGFVHGYKVQTTGSADQYQLGVSGEATKSLADLETGSTESAPGSVRTRFYDSKGNRCDMQGISEWSADDSKGGIYVRLVDLLKCGKADLDVQQSELRSYVAGEKGVPTMRLAGAQVVLDFTYENQAIHQEDFTDELCKVFVSVDPAWNSRTAFAPLQLPNPSTNISEYYTTYMYGISVVAKPTGSMAFIDWSAFINSLTSMIVILGLPPKVIAFLAVSLVGRFSKIYRKSSTEKLDIDQQISSIAARQFSAMASFRSITSQQRVPLQDLQDMPDSQVEELAEDVFAGGQGVSDGDNRARAKLLAHFLVEKMDLNGTGGVSMNDFMTVATRNEAMTIDDIGKLVSSGTSILEKIFSSHGRLFGEGGGDKAAHTSDVKPVLARQETVQLADLAEQQKKVMEQQKEVMESLEELRMMVKGMKHQEPDLDQGQAPQASSRLHPWKSPREPLRQSQGESLQQPPRESPRGPQSPRLSLVPIEDKNALEMIRHEMLEMQDLGLKTIINRTDSVQMSHQINMNRRLRDLEERVNAISNKQDKQL
eukprot:TRINITY_DN8792_c0_g3_i1.p1 TRINITY_DN8792_c0_g3~~TRINITY_DN8792_c0_g3_i1.p1  ORF type:complete len:736 (+),score=101.73 TRINITY_DN8792_c0_g3_i1:55-2208(+)